MAKFAGKKAASKKKPKAAPAGGASVKTEKPKRMVADYMRSWYGRS